jgi:uncharacterized protein YndB with AHSA1/START domain
MAPIVGSVEVARRPEEVFAYLTDVDRLTEWQDSLVSARRETGEGFAVGSTMVTTRRVGGVERTMTMEVTEASPPGSWAVRGIDGPIRAIVRGTVEPLADGERSRVTIKLDFAGHGIGKLLVPLVVRRQARAEMPKNTSQLKRLLEAEA